MNDTHQKMKLGIEALQKGHAFKFEDLSITAPSISSVVVTGWSRYKILDNLSRDIAKSELEAIIHSFIDIISRSPELRKFISNKEMEYCLDLDYYHGAVRVCREKDGSIEWFID